MLGPKKTPSVAELRAWIETELENARAAYASHAHNSPEAASFHARRSGYLDASLEVIDWFETELADSK